MGIYLDSIRRSTWIIADGALTAQVAKVPSAVLQAADDVVVLGRLPRQDERRLTSEEEGRFVGRVRKESVFSAGCLQRTAAVDPRTAGLRPGEPILRESRSWIVDALPEAGSWNGCQRSTRLVAA